MKPLLLLALCLSAGLALPAQLQPARTDGTTHLESGRKWLQQGELEKAHAEFNRAIAAAPRLAAAWYRRGGGGFLTREYEAALTDLRRPSS
jgi:Tfp pilus assembly protein PilF